LSFFSYPAYMADFLISPEEYEHEREYQHAWERFFELMRDKESADLLNKKIKSHEEENI